MKKILALMMVCLMAGTCIACKNKDDNVKSDGEVTSGIENIVESDADSSLESDGASDGVTSDGEVA